MFSLERLLIAFSAFLGDSISKTPKVHVLVCLCAFGLLAVGIVLVEIEHDVFKLWVRFRSRYHRVSNEDIFHHRDDDDVFLSSFSRSSEKNARDRNKNARTRDRGKSSFDAFSRSFLLLFKTEEEERTTLFPPPFFPHLSGTLKEAFS